MGGLEGVAENADRNVGPEEEQDGARRSFGNNSRLSDLALRVRRGEFQPRVNDTGVLIACGHGDSATEQTMAGERAAQSLSFMENDI